MIALFERTGVIAFLACCATLAQAAVVDILPGDYVALAPGAYGLTGYLYQRIPIRRACAPATLKYAPMWPLCAFPASTRWPA